jgi:hypothetical protein
VDLVEVARMSTCLLLGVLSAYGRHGGQYPRPSVIRVES